MIPTSDEDVKSVPDVQLDRSAEIVIAHDRDEVRMQSRLRSQPLTNRRLLERALVGVCPSAAGPPARAFCPNQKVTTAAYLDVAPVVYITEGTLSDVAVGLDSGNV